MPHVTPPFVSILLFEGWSRAPDGPKHLHRLLGAFIATDIDNETPKMPPMKFRCFVRFEFYGGPFTGAPMLSMTWLSPNGDRRLLKEEPQPFDGRNRTIEYLFPIELETAIEGVHWIEGWVDSELKNATPFEVTYIPPAKGQAGPS